MNATRIIFAVFCIKLSAGDNQADFFSKFNQHDYDVKYERFVAERYDKSMMKSLAITTFKYNRTTAVANITMEFKKDLGFSMDVIVQLYKFLSNEYRHFPVRFRVNFCAALESNIFGAKNSMSCGNFTGCPLVKDKLYHICNYQPDSTKFPPLMPSGSYMGEFSFISPRHGENIFMVWKGYGTTEYPMKF